MMFFDQLKLKIQESQTRLCLGVDPQIPSGSRLVAENNSDIEAVDQIVTVLVSLAIEHQLPVVKFQSAYFEAYGSEGFKILQKSFGRLKEAKILSILDAKRGDISSTMHAYGRSAFDMLQADCLTINPYMGIDTIEPLLPWLQKGKGVYVVWLTSNESADLLQMQRCEDSVPFASHVHAIFKRFAQNNLVENSVGFVLGATKLSNDAVKFLLSDLKEEFFLLPGVGAQGAKVDTPMNQFLLKHFASLVPVSREIGGLKPEIESIDEYACYAKTRLTLLKAKLALPA